jgi:hypothetical protein
LCILLTVIGCKGQIDAWVRADWIFENASTRKVEVVSRDFNSFVIQPGESYTYSESGEGQSDLTPDRYLSPYDAGNKIIVDENPGHVLQNGESITEVMNYEAEKVKRNYYRFTYRFTDELLQSFED